MFEGDSELLLVLLDEDEEVGDGTTSVVVFAGELLGGAARECIQIGTGRL